MWHARYFCPILNKPGLSWHVFIEDPNIKYHGKTSNRSRVDICEWTDRQTYKQTYSGADRRTDEHDDADRRFPRICERAYKFTTSGAAFRVWHVENVAYTYVNVRELAQNVIGTNGSQRDRLKKNPNW